MTDQEILDLFAPVRKNKKTGATIKAMVIDENGAAQWVQANKADMGSFHGKVGTPKRSRKGRTYNAPNWSRWYPHSHSAYGSEVIAYKP